MSLIKNAYTLLTSPATMRDYALYHASKLRHGIPVRHLHGIRLSSFNSFSEFHTCNSVNKAERIFISTFDFSDGAIVDVGANLGIVSILLAKRFPERPVYSFEPNPSTFRALNANLKLNGISNVKTFQTALSDVHATVMFDADPHSRATNKITDKGQHLVAVKSTTLDTFLEKNNVEQVAFLKIDVEGLEEKVLEGARGALQRKSIKVIYYEVCPDNALAVNLSPSAPAEILLSHAYHLYRLTPDLRFAQLSEIHTTILDNWVAIADPL